MKKIILFLILISFISCGSIYNELEIKIKKTENSTNIDSLKRSIIRMDGITSVVICTAPLEITVVYNRLKNSEENILTNIKKNNYESYLLKKKRIKNR
ncbi:MAG: hypothetical protein U9R41_07060 [Candidatus Marinimicrobia bacterium]|nr:hypothetical protein [Candidatus Neomarinimicrobiota bacterium]